MFKFFDAVGVKYMRDKEGKILYVRDRKKGTVPMVEKEVHGSGVVRDCQETPGAIMRQVPRLIGCDSVSYTLRDIDTRTITRKPVYTRRYVSC